MGLTRVAVIQLAVLCCLIPSAQLFASDKFSKSSEAEISFRNVVAHQSKVPVADLMLEFRKQKKVEADLSCLGDFNAATLSQLGGVDLTEVSSYSNAAVVISVIRNINGSPVASDTGSGLIVSIDNVEYLLTAQHVFGDQNQAIAKTYGIDAKDRRLNEIGNIIEVAIGNWRDVNFDPEPTPEIFSRIGNATITQLGLNFGGETPAGSSLQDRGKQMAKYAEDDWIIIRLPDDVAGTVDSVDLPFLCPLFGNNNNFVSFHHAAERPQQVAVGTKINDEFGLSERQSKANLLQISKDHGKAMGGASGGVIIDHQPGFPLNAGVLSTASIVGADGSLYTDALVCSEVADRTIVAAPDLNISITPAISSLHSFLSGASVNRGDCGSGAEGILANKEYQLVMDADANGSGNGRRVQAWNWSGLIQQQWEFDYFAGEIRSKIDGRCLDVHMGDSVPGGIQQYQVQLWDCSNQSNQKWIFNTDGSIENVAANEIDGTRWLLDIENGGNGTRLKVSPYHSTAGLENQKWTSGSAISVEISPGWNFLGANHKNFSNMKAQDLCDQINTQLPGTPIVEVDRWNAGGWEGHICGLPFNNFDIDSNQGYFLKSSGSGVFNFFGNFSTAFNVNSVVLKPGWNAVAGVGVGSAQDLCDLISQTGQTPIEVDRWNAGGWDGHICGLPFNNFNIDADKGYFVKLGS